MRYLLIVVFFLALAFGWFMFIDSRCAKFCGINTAYRNGLTCQCFKKDIGSGYDVEVIINP